MAEEIKIEIKDDSTKRDNPDLEDFFNGTSSSSSSSKKKSEPPPLPKREKAEPNFPDTVDIDGETIGKKAYDAAQKRMEREKESEEAQKAYDLLNPDKKKSAWMKNPMGELMKVVPELAVVALAADSAATAIGLMAKNANAVSDALGTMASNERAGLGQLGDAATGALRGPFESIPFVGGMIKAQDDLTDAITKLPEKMTAAFLKQADKVGPYSGAIQGANARADVREIMADLREAEGLGTDYGRLIDAQSRIDNSLRELIYPIKEFVLKVLADRLELLATVAENTGKTLDITGILANTIIKVFGDMAVPGTGIFNAALDIRQGVKDINKKLNENKDPPKDLFDSFFESVGEAKFSGSFAG